MKDAPEEMQRALEYLETAEVMILECGVGAPSELHEWNVSEIE